MWLIDWLYTLFDIKRRAERRVRDAIVQDAFAVATQGGSTLFDEASYSRWALAVFAQMPFDDWMRFLASPEGRRQYAAVRLRELRVALSVKLMLQKKEVGANFDEQRFWRLAADEPPRRRRAMTH